MKAPPTPSILVTGGAGYIGSHTVRMLSDLGQRVVVLDNLSEGHRDALINEEVELVVANLGDSQEMEALFSQHSFEAVVHFAAHCYVGESVKEPLKYYRNNTAAPIALLEAMRDHSCKRFVFSSTCATYGNPVVVPMDETHPQQPINPYGRSKWMTEQILEDCDRAYGIRSVCLRYFNACGCSLDAAIGEDHDPETHLIPLALMAARGDVEKLTVFGTDYDTPDGTCIRDYVHVEDLARAHVKALEYLGEGAESISCNLGTGKGTSVREIIRATERVTGKSVPVEYGERRPGDPPELVADPQKSHDVLGWTARHCDLTEIVSSAWQWMSGPKQGRYAK